MRSICHVTHNTTQQNLSNHCTFFFPLPFGNAIVCGARSPLPRSPIEHVSNEHQRIAPHTHGMPSRRRRPEKGFERKSGCVFRAFRERMNYFDKCPTVSFAIAKVKIVKLRSEAPKSKAHTEWGKREKKTRKSKAFLCERII